MQQEFQHPNFRRGSQSWRLIKRKETGAQKSKAQLVAILETSEHNVQLKLRGEHLENTVQSLNLQVEGLRHDLRDYAETIRRQRGIIEHYQAGHPPAVVQQHAAWYPPPDPRAIAMLHHPAVYPSNTPAFIPPISVKPPIPRILVVDDNSVSRSLAAKILQALCCHVETAEDGLEAISIMRNSASFDICLMDIGMQKLDGIMETQRIRGTPSPALRLYHRDLAFDQTIPIVPLTASFSDQDCYTYSCNGMQGIVRKPFQKSDFAELLVTWIRGYKCPAEPEAKTAAGVAANESSATLGADGPVPPDHHHKGQGKVFPVAMKYPLQPAPTQQQHPQAQLPLQYQTQQHYASIGTPVPGAPIPGAPLQYTQYPVRPT